MTPDHPVAFVVSSTTQSVLFAPRPENLACSDFKVLGADLANLVSEAALVAHHEAGHALVAEFRPRRASACRPDDTTSHPVPRARLGEIEGRDLRG